MTCATVEMVMSIQKATQAHSKTSVTRATVADMLDEYGVVPLINHILNVRLHHDSPLPCTMPLDPFTSMSDG